MAKGAAVEGGGGEGVEVMCDAASRSSVPRLPARAAGAERLTMHAGGERPWAMHGVVMLARTDAKARWSWVRRRHDNFASRRGRDTETKPQLFLRVKSRSRMTSQVKQKRSGNIVHVLYGGHTAQTVNRPSSRMSQNLMFDLFLLLLLCMHRPPSRLDARRASKLPPPHPLVHPLLLLPLLPLLLPRPLGRG